MSAPSRPRVRLVPTGYGLAYLASCVALLAVAMLYNNNLCFILAFLVLSIMVATTPATLAHARGLRVLGVRCEPAYAGGRASYVLAVRQERSRAADVLLALGGVRTRGVVSREATAHLEIDLPAPRRGWLDPGPATLMTEYPLGLFRVSFRVRVPPCLVYPRPLEGPEALRPVRNAGQRSRSDASGTEDFRDLTSWQPGHPLSRIAWKASARGQGLQTKVFDTLVGRAPVFDWYALESDGELRLSRLCHMVLEASRSGVAFGLRLPDVELAVARGAGHRRRALTALALHGGSGVDHG